MFEDLGKIMKQFVHNFYSLGEFEVTYVPSHKAKQAKRGFNQAEILAKEINESYLNLLERVKETKTQAGMSELERLGNLKNGFVLNDVNLKSKTIVIVDDVYTTGSTLEECARVIKAKHPEVKVYGFTFARSRIN